MCTQKLSLSVGEIRDYPQVKSDEGILQALKECAPTKTIETLKKKVPNLSNESLLEEALKYNNPEETIRFLFNTGAKPAWEHLKQALQRQYAKEVVELLVHHMDKSNLEVALLLALECNNSFEIIKLLIDAGAPCEHICVLRVMSLKPSPAIIDLVTEAHRQWSEKLKAHRKKREEEQKQTPKYDDQLKANNKDIPTNHSFIWKDY